jgi:hypothetical protein
MSTGTAGAGEPGNERATAVASSVRLSWMDFFRGLPVTVEPEKDLSVKKQLLDVLVIHKEAAVLDCRLPDGFEGLAAYNLITFKSQKEKLSAWTLKELIGHYVNLRKQVSPSMDEDELLPEEQFQLYAVTSRFPQQLAGRDVVLEPVSEGVYDVPILTSRVRIVVANQLPEQEHNAMLHLFSTRLDLLRYGARHGRVRSWETSSLLYQLYRFVQQEGEIMPDMLEEFAREAVDRLLRDLPVEKRLEGLTVEQLLQELKKLPPESKRELVEGLKGNGTSAEPE